MKSASALEGALGVSPALAAVGESDLLDAPGAPGWTIAAGGAGGGADCCASEVRRQSARAEAAKAELNVRDNDDSPNIRLCIWAVRTSCGPG